MFAFLGRENPGNAGKVYTRAVQRALQGLPHCAGYGGPIVFTFYCVMASKITYLREHGELSFFCFIGSIATKSKSNEGRTPNLLHRKVRRLDQLHSRREENLILFFHALSENSRT
ncbi:hypothetical protein KP509_28G015000 [Ceratopteris richardii]|uniref:Uncharacterized protein n=1 Tax=Ceratopteris richardii TaxID=49495 RepID=A0A8T2RC02_CERRI|nr:hypothetical protein KP509_28G015000 [Ceratopteris richardii]